MGLDFAIDELYATGWSPLDTRDCERHDDGRPFPSLARVEQEFAAAGFPLKVRHVQLFDCYRAEWHDGTGQPAGAVVGRTAAEAAVFALSQMRRATSSVSAVATV
ncbi:MAG: hypothetical protein DYG93_04475 [Leptolyngbya sp. PLA2]|nr:hypothetical protein [Leptolyngbya sp.]MCE7970904.1 hypothetical protein [Leptolyngbya sp. PL-A2]MCQ3940281.1 hypothetical protein [cyanobacterium CYA1]MCZ7633745.1 hypothetical protein [Phycisphaerales bacterium]MDL1904649.1 hypothetical protein [Synechococcales cyanobacterium CNB]GIK20401.1 MAG: hypothetical protein BroJett004_25650 [Planctomycetota bacterium]